MDLTERKIVVGVTGGIAAYKAAELCRQLQQAGAAVRVVMTKSATEFVTPLTFAALTQHPVCVSLFSPQEESSIDHIALIRWGELLIVAPATANIIGKFASGVADDALSTLHLAWPGQLLIAPAMNPRMWEHPAVQENIGVLRKRGAGIIGPEAGEAACGDQGVGRMAEPASIIEAIDRFLGKKKSAPQTLNGKRVLITAGPTREQLDPVRFISNPSYGKMGFALAEEAANRGARVTVLTGPVSLNLSAEIERVDIESAAELHQAALARWAEQDIIIFAAAVGDLQPITPHTTKIKDRSATITLEFQRTVDIAAELGQLAAQDSKQRVLVGFAAETDNIEEHAKKKLRDKRLDLIVANDVGQSGGVFGSDENAATLIPAQGSTIRLERISKHALAACIFDQIEAF